MLVLCMLCKPVALDKLCVGQEEETRRRLVREVAYDLQRRVKQELAFPAVIHFYSWLLQGKPCTFTRENPKSFALCSKYLSFVTS